MASPLLLRLIYIECPFSDRGMASLLSRKPHTLVRMCFMYFELGLIIPSVLV